MTDTVFFTAQELMKGLRRMLSRTNRDDFKRRFFPQPHHTEEYVTRYWIMFRDSPHLFWASVDEDRQHMFEYLLDDHTNLELQAEKRVVA